LASSLGRVATKIRVKATCGAILHDTDTVVAGNNKKW